MAASRFTTAMTMMLLTTVCLSTASAHDHTHIGINQDGIGGTGDDNKLWIFATGAQPRWGTIELLPSGDFIGDKQIYRARLDCWHSAHPDHGAWQLGGTDPLQSPAWSISLKRISFSDSDYFRMVNSLTGQPVLAKDGDTSQFSPVYMTDKYNESGTLGAWGIHTHLEFEVLASGPGETFSAVFTVFDTGTTGYLESAPYTMQFITVPEPASLLLLAAGCLLRPKRRA